MKCLRYSLRGIVSRAAYLEQVLYYSATKDPVVMNVSSLLKKSHNSTPHLLTRLMQRTSSLMEQSTDPFTLLVQILGRLLRHRSLRLVVRAHLEAFPGGGVVAEQLLQRLDDAFDRGQEILLLQYFIERSARDVCL